MNYGAGIFFDGTTSARQTVSVELGGDSLLVRDNLGSVLADWPYEDMQQLPAPKDVLRLALRDDPILARLEIRDLEFATAIDDRSLAVDRSGATDRRARRRVIAWTAIASASLVACAVFLVPAIAARLAPVIPMGIERKLGEAVDSQVRAMLDNRRLGERFTCGHAEAERAGQAALDLVIARLSQAAALPAPLHVSVVRRAEANAIALPGGHIYVFQGLIGKAGNADELAGVIAHEIGHVAHRDGTRSMLQAAGLSLLFGTLLGDFVGGSAIVLAARALIQSSYSRSVEMAADAYSVRLMARVGADAAALGTLLRRIEGDRRPGMRIWLDHPEVGERVRNINAIAPSPPGASLLDPAQWAALQRICEDN
jgi:Zn-dependent protease with chaperone function